MSQSRSVQIEKGTRHPTGIIPARKILVTQKKRSTDNELRLVSAPEPERRIRTHLKEMGWCRWLHLSPNHIGCFAVFLLHHAPACTVVRYGDHKAVKVTDEDELLHRSAVDAKLVRYRPQRWERRWGRVPVRDFHFDALDTR